MKSALFLKAELSSVEADMSHSKILVWTVKYNTYSNQTQHIVYYDENHPDPSCFPVIDFLPEHFYLLLLTQSPNVKRKKINKKNLCVFSQSGFTLDASQTCCAALGGSTHDELLLVWGGCKCVPWSAAPPSLTESWTDSSCLLTPTL